MGKFKIISKEKERRAISSRASLFIKIENFSKHLPNGKAPLAGTGPHVLSPAAKEAGKVSLWNGTWALPTRKTDGGEEWQHAGSHQSLPQSEVLIFALGHLGIQCH